MTSRTKTLMGLTTAALLIAGVALASDSPPESTVVERTVIPVDGAGTVTLEVVSGGLSIVTADPEPGWTVTVETMVGLEVEARFESGEGRVDFSAELEDGEIRVEIERSVEGRSSTASVASTSTTQVGGGSTSTTLADRASTTSTTVDDDDATTPTTIDDDVVVGIPDGVRSFGAGAAGTVTVGIRSGALELVAVEPGSGWSHEVDKVRSDDIEVEFWQGDSEVEIRIRVNDGRLEMRVDGD